MKPPARPAPNTTPPTVPLTSPSTTANPVHPPYDVSAFGRLSYGEAPVATTGVATGLGGGGVTLNGTVNPNGFEVESCRFQYIEAALYEQNEGEAKPLFEGAEEVQCEPDAAELGKGTKAVAVHADVTRPIPKPATASAWWRRTHTAKEWARRRCSGPRR